MNLLDRRNFRFKSCQDWVNIWVAGGGSKDCEQEGAQSSMSLYQNQAEGEECLLSPSSLISSPGAGSGGQKEDNVAIVIENNS